MATAEFAPAGPPNAIRNSDEPLLVTDLLVPVDVVLGRLVESLRRGQVLDGFLLAAGAVQIVEDHLQRDTASLRRAAEFLGGRVARPLHGVAAVAEFARRITPAQQRAQDWRSDAAALRDDLAAAALRHREGSTECAVPTGALPRAQHLAGGLAALPARLPGDLLRLPTCFRSFDLGLPDMERLAAGYAPSVVGRRVLVVGVRTSGSYLAPLIAAALHGHGVDASTITMRPGRPLFPADRLRVERVRDAGGAVAVIDDPPNTGAALRSAVVLLRAHGVDPTILLPMFGDHAPPALDGTRRITLPFRDWAVHERLRPCSVLTTLNSLTGAGFTHIECLRETDPAAGREHVEAVFRVRDAAGHERQVGVLGTGAGYFGRFAVAVAAALPGRLPRNYGVRDGLAFREWLPAADRVERPRPGDATVYADHIAARAAALPATADRSLTLAGRHPVWEIASRLLAGGYGRVGLALRLPVLDPTVRRLCAVEHPSVIDGATDLRHWYRSGGTLLKTTADLRAFSNLDRSCYDPVYDLAGVDPGGRDGAFTAALRAAYPTDPERFLLYQLVHLQDPASGQFLDRRAPARAVLRYMAEHHPAPDTTPGPLCAIDLDGVLESNALGFSVLTPTATVALRALAAHGHRPVPVTGRSLDEVRERCEILGLAGGVAEYGAVAYTHATGEVRDLVTADDRALLDRLRSVLAAEPDVTVDDDFRYCLRAHRARPRRGALPTTTIDAALETLGPDRHRLRVITGEAQTDIVAAATDKGIGLRALALMLDPPGGVRLAVGDTVSDLPMFALAESAFAPGNADPAVRNSGMPVLRASYAAGFAAAVARVLGHPPGRCAVCRPPAHEPTAAALLAILDAQHAGRRGLAAAAAAATVHALRLRW